MKAFAQKYGKEKDEMDKKAVGMGYTGQYRASFPYTALSEGIENIRRTRILMAEDLVRRAGKRLDAMGNIHEFHVFKEYGQIQALVNMALRYQSDNPRVKEVQVQVGRRITNGLKTFNASIDSRKWPDHAGNAPSDAGALAEQALEWFNHTPGWGRPGNPLMGEHGTPLSVVITGPWFIQKRNILGEPDFIWASGFVGGATGE